ncbi:hypothetical protein [Parasegetibacter sp. NRK P23]|uniref:DUF7079 family protein n=1 Tax=Parasegetibacter sp. NRK P23 TaxID=2942999 RepID=UPI0020441061|nr:hypothetical protein [Parasegetibacter sp. NRK P23]MCM5530636.1 hypothetical protein [Parasegetibacter sp. NRK P23]
MEFIRRLFNISKKSNDSWTMFSTSKAERKGLLVSMGEITIGDDFLKIENYPFEPSIAYKQNIFKANQIDDIDVKSYPPTFRIGNEIVFLESDKKEILEVFAAKNGVKTVERSWIWGWILEPFLDTEYTAETDQRLTKLLESHGLTAGQVKSIRAEVETQMLKYNFDTMLWEWGGFDASDVLKAMRTKYKKDEYEDFYRRVMEIALLSIKTAE